MTDGTRPTRVLLISGYGRSGSTLLARILGEVEGMVAVGELRHLWREGFVENRRCSCGERFHACPYWREVTGQAFGGMEAVDAATVLCLQRIVDRPSRIPLLAAGRGSAVFRAARARYTAALSRLYRALARVSGARVLVDSSKDVSHGYLLAGMGRALDLTVVHLVRDSRGAVHSWQKPKYDPGQDGYMNRYGLVRACTEWNAINLLAEGVARLAPRRLRVSYGELVGAPRVTTARILSLAGEEHASPPFLDDRRVRLRLGHAVSGNPMRFTEGEMEIRADHAWRREMAPGRRAVTTALTWPLARRYGLTRRPASARTSP